MDNQKFNHNTSVKELNAELLRILDEFGTLNLQHLRFAEAVASAENLGLKEKLQQASIKMMFMRQKAFYLNLRYTRVVNLIIQKQRDFVAN